MSALIFTPETHTYELEGDVLPTSVTGVLRTAGLINYDSVPPHILEAARIRGTAVHQAVHYYNEQDLDVERFSREYPAYAGYLQSWVAFMETGRLRTVLCEHRVASRHLQLAGTIDWLGEFDGHGALIDFATGAPADSAKDLQTAAYLSLAREWSTEPGEDPLRAFIAEHPFIRRYSIRLNKGGRLPQPVPYTSVTDARDFFTLLSAQQLVKRRQPAAIDWSEWAA